MNIVAFLSYVLITSITPGPSNLLVMNEARRFGFVGAWKFTCGILAGFAALGIVSGIFTMGLTNSLPVLEPYFKMAGASYLLYLAWHIGVPKSSKNNSTEVQATFLSGFIFQIINIKSILFFLTVMTAFILPVSSSIGQIVLYLIYTIFLGWGALLFWSGFGSVFSKFFMKHDKSFRFSMSLLLVYSAAAIFLS